MADFHKGKRPDLSNVEYKSCKMYFPSNNPHWTISKPRYIDQRLINELDKLIDKYGIEMVNDYVTLRKENHDKYSMFREIMNNTEDESLDTIDRPMTEEEDEEYELPEPFGEKPYRPFQDTAELILHYEKHFNVDYPSFYEPMMWVKVKDESDARFFITMFSEYYVKIDGEFVSMKKLFENFVFLDNSPCGSKESEE